LTQKALEMDERNFHCWDYRRFLVKSGSNSPADELAFTHLLIEKNFSNCSSWHERSRLLPVVHPGEKHLISDEALKNELQLIENAAFTDPDDQTAWIYLPWLVESSRDLKVNRVTSIVVLGNEIFVFFRSSVERDEEIIAQTMSNLGVDCDKADGFPNADFSRVWRFSDPKCGVMPSVAEISGAFTDRNPISRSLSEKEGLVTFASSNGVMEEQITELVSSCEQLLQLEPKSKWANCFYAYLLETTNFEEKFDKILSLYERFPVLDPLRKGFFEDMRSKLIFKALASSSELVAKLMLSSRGLTSVHFVPQLLFVKEVDLSRNRLTDTKALGTMLSVRRLVLDSNRIESLDGLQALSQLEVLSVADNKVEDLSELERLRELRCLMQLNIAGNPVAKLAISDLDSVIPNSVELMT
jgi:geranylgeranyl transferase type-2 subunit alpha